MYLCEPLLNTALELQAISRVHRIGQTRSTTVWQFTISSTVEESIFRLSSEKRLEMIRRDYVKRDSTEPGLPIVSNQALDVSNSYQLSNLNSKMIGRGAAGEHIGSDDLWTVLFGYNDMRDTKEMSYDKEGLRMAV